MTARFRPTRCGIINLWDYRDEEFVFADGRMVLRGPNGSGKTKALEVLFPFVFDGRIEPRRLNPFAGEERTMKSNLLYRGQESAHAYVWMEFRTDAGEAVTVGVGLRAQRQNDRVTRWYFVTDGQVGQDFSLLGPDDRPLTRRQLGEQIGADRITERPQEHRAAIDARLFELGPARYEQLLTLILTLRRPQLAKNLDPKGLSQALADGLRPLDESLINEAAHSFGDMESVQRTLASLVLADAAAQQFLSGYTTYLRTHARAAADVVTARLAGLTAARSARALALDERRRSELAEGRARDERERAGDTRTTLAARLDSLKASSAYRDRAQLVRLADLTGELAQAAARDEQAAARCGAEHSRREVALTAATQAHELAISAVARAAGDLLNAAAEAGIDWQPRDQAEDGQLGVRASARVTAREEDIDAVRVLVARLDESRRHRERMRAALERAQNRVSAAQAALDAAEATVTMARAELVSAIQSWLLENSSIVAWLAGGAAAAFAGAAEFDDLPPLGEVFARYSALPSEQTRDQVAAARAALSQLRSDIAGRQAEREDIAAQRDQSPPAFAARTDERDPGAGAPLWATVDFTTGVSEEEAAGVEAALQAANLLDAWVSGAGGVVGADRSEAMLVALPVRLRPKGRTLADVLVPESGGPVPIETVAAVLASVALDEPGQPAVAPSISTSGRFGQGIQIGAHHKPHAEYIGATARARRRAARLAELDAQLVDARSHAGEIEDDLAALEALLAAAAAALEALPSTGPLSRAGREVETAAAALRATNDSSDAARSDYDQALADTSAADRILTTTAGRRALPTVGSEIDVIASAVGHFTRAATYLDSQRQLATGRQEARNQAEAEVNTAGAARADAVEQAHESASAHLARAEELRTLRSAVGADADQVERDVAQTATALVAAGRALTAAQSAVERAISESGQTRGRVEGAIITVRSAVRETQNESRRLAPYARPDVRDALRLPSALPPWPTAVEQWPAVEPLVDNATDDAAERSALPVEVDALLSAILAVTSDLRPNEASLKSSRTRVSGSLAELQNQLSSAGHDYRPEWEADDDVIVVKVADEQGFSSIGEFAERIATARADQEVLLTESERRVLEDALLGRLAQQIHERTTDARDLIGAMNREMRSRRMSSGQAIGIGWEMADSLDPEQRAVSRLLDREAAQLSSSELAQMRAHFAGQIKNLRAARPDRPYAEILSDALDYRSWRSFMLTLVAPDGREDRLTQARHSTLSGGEQSVSLHLPLFAAAHVLLSSAAAHSPRLLALDEAFAGIDDSGRSELLGLTTQFDLDLFMTGYDLWATYPTVSGCTHHDLSHSTIEHTVSSLLMVWNGSELVSDAEISSGVVDLARSLGSPGTRRVLVADPGGLDTE